MKVIKCNSVNEVIVPFKVSKQQNVKPFNETRIEVLYTLGDSIVLYHKWHFDAVYYL
jgi:hypothetical protein